MTDNAVTLFGTVDHLTIQAGQTVMLTGDLTVTGPTLVHAGGNLITNGHRLYVIGGLDMEYPKFAGGAEAAISVDSTVRLTSGVTVFRPETVGSISNGPELKSGYGYIGGGAYVVRQPIVVIGTIDLGDRDA